MKKYNAIEWSAAELIHNFKDLTMKQSDKSNTKIQFLFQPVVELPKGPVPLSINTTESTEEEIKKPINGRLSPQSIARLNSSSESSEVMQRISKLYEQHQQVKRLIQTKGMKGGMRHCTSHPELSCKKVKNSIRVE